MDRADEPHISIEADLTRPSFYAALLDVQCGDGVEPTESPTGRALIVEDSGDAVA